jgi:hypothetical protein
LSGDIGISTAPFAFDVMPSAAGPVKHIKARMQGYDAWTVTAADRPDAGHRGLPEAARGCPHTTETMQTTSDPPPSYKALYSAAFPDDPAATP